MNFLILITFFLLTKVTFAEYKTYVGVQGGFIYSDNEGNADKTAQDLADASGRTVTYTYEELTWGIRPYGGFNVNDKVSIEVGYIFSGSLDETYKGSTAASGAWNATQGVSVDGVDGAVKFNFDNLYAKIGMHQLTVEAFAGFTSNGFTYNGGASRSGSGFLLGGGYQDSLGDDLYWNAEYVYYESVGGISNATMSFFAVGIEKRF